MEDMTELLTSLPQKTMEPKIYSLVVKTNRLVILHMGVYYTLDEAFAAVKQRALEESGIKDAPMNVDMWMWEILPANAVLNKMFGKDFQGQFQIMKQPTADLSKVEIPIADIGTSEYVKQVYDMRNELMKRIIDTKDVAALDEAKPILTKAELKLIREKIIPKTEQI